MLPLSGRSSGCPVLVFYPFAFGRSDLVRGVVSTRAVAPRAYLGDKNVNEERCSEPIDCRSSLTIGCKSRTRPPNHLRG
jgi:hypothetical protein